MCTNLYFYGRNSLEKEMIRIKPVPRVRTKQYKRTALFIEWVQYLLSKNVNSKDIRKALDMEMPRYASFAFTRPHAETKGAAYLFELVDLYKAFPVLLRDRAAKAEIIEVDDEKAFDELRRQNKMLAEAIENLAKENARLVKANQELRASNQEK